MLGDLLRKLDLYIYIFLNIILNILEISYIHMTRVT